MRSNVDPVALLDDALDALTIDNPGDLDDATLTARLIELARRVNRLQAQFCRHVGLAHRRGAAQAAGCRSTRAMLRRRLRMTVREAAKHVTTAAAMDSLPETAAAFEAGEISLDHAHHISRTARQVGTRVMAGGGERLMLGEARLDSPTRVWHVGRSLRERLCPDEDELRRTNLFRERWLSLARTFQGAVSVQGVLDPVTGDLLHAALAAVKPRVDSPDTLVRPEPPPRSAVQQRVDGLAEMCRIVLVVRGAEAIPRVEVHC